jgi:hypothetical protein
MAAALFWQFSMNRSVAAVCELCVLTNAPGAVRANEDRRQLDRVARGADVRMSHCVARVRTEAGEERLVSAGLVWTRVHRELPTPLGADINDSLDTWFVRLGSTEVRSWVAGERTIWLRRPGSRSTPAWLRGVLRDPG